MDHYIDFEASEAEHKIISVGCIRENGETFYSLVRTDDPLTPRITEITGISQEEVDGAPSVDEVFSAFYDWCGKDDGTPKFMCYGNGDFDFIYNTFYDAKTLKAASILGFLYLDLYDVSDDIKEHFYVNKTISLEKLARYFDDSVIKQNHNALDDAILLKTVYEGVKSGKVKTSVFDEYLDPKRMPVQVKKVIRLNGDTILNEFANMKEAVEWIRSQPNDKGPQYIKDAEDKIKKAARDNGKYFRSNWRIL